jgi:hypothetical protein
MLDRATCTKNDTTMKVEIPFSEYLRDSTKDVLVTACTFTVYPTKV